MHTSFLFICLIWYSGGKKNLYILKYQPITQNSFFNNFGVSGRIDPKLCVLLGTSIVHALNTKFLSGQVRSLTCDVISKGPSI